MRVLQIRELLSYGDGIGNTIVTMDRVLSKKFDTIIAVRKYSEEHEFLARLIRFNRLDELDIQSDDIVIYHFGEWSLILQELMDIKCKKILMYQNVTYPYFYTGINEGVSLNCLKAQQYVRNTTACFLKALTPSSFSRNELIDMGWKSEDVYLLPLPVSLERKTITRKNNNEERRFLFVGRMVPNKKIEDVIRVFDYYRNKYYKNSYLKLVGDKSKDVYFEALCKYIEANHIENVEFLGRVSDEELEEIYRSSDIYLCMSEHEGFCIPLIEAMSYEIPVVAYNATAVPDTMGDAGVLLDSKDPKYVCEKIDRIFEDESYRKQLIEVQNRHIDTYIRDDYEKKLFDIIEEVKAFSSYSYNDSSIEFYKILLEEIEKSGEKYLQEQIQRLKDRDKPIVLYGAGKVGTTLLEYFKNNELPIEAICDVGKCGDEIEGKIIMSPNECTQKCPDAIYIITVQNSGIVSEISDNLLDWGVSRNNVFRYSNRDKMIVI